MVRIALRMLLGDRAKYLSLVLGLSFAVLLIVQQGAIFMGLMLQATGPLQNISQADLWVGDPYLKWVTETRNLNESDLNRIRSTPGVAWAEPFFNTRAACDLPNGDFRFVNIVGIPRSTMVGRPPQITRGRLEDLRISDAVLVEELEETCQKFEVAKERRLERERKMAEKKEMKNLLVTSSSAAS